MLAAMGGATVNSLQEQGWDAMFSRTANRPMVQREISVAMALALAAIAAFSSLLLLWLSAQQPYAVIGLTLLALLIYNLVYTPLKAKTLLAIVPGAVCGGLPPVIGWAAGGGPLSSATAALLFVLLFLWQVPHFCLILLLHKQDYCGQKQPTFLSYLSEPAVRRLSVVWIGAMAVVMMLFCVVPRPLEPFIQAVVALNALGISSLICIRLIKGNGCSLKMTFTLLNGMLGFHMAVMMVGSQVG